MSERKSEYDNGEYVEVGGAPAMVLYESWSPAGDKFVTVIQGGKEQTVRADSVKSADKEMGDD